MFRCPICRKVLTSTANSTIADHVWRHVRDIVPDREELIRLRRAATPQDKCPDCDWAPDTPFPLGSEVGGHRARAHDYNPAEAALAVYQQKRKAPRRRPPRDSARHAPHASD